MSISFHLENVATYSVYQPVYSLDSNQIVGYEALIRSHAGLSPEELFYIAEKLGKTIDFDIQCLDKAISNLPKIKGKLFVNIRPSTLIWLYKNRREWFENLPSDQIIFEITEIEKITDVENFVQILKDLRKNRFKYSIDDIANGHNRLHLLVASEPDYIKLNGPIIKDCDKSSNKRSIIRHLVGIGNDIGSTVIAENIENKRELQTVCNLGVPLAQGFYLGKPSRSWLIG